MSTIPHPTHLLPDNLTVSFQAWKPMTMKELSDFINGMINEYFDISPMARKLWHDHAELMISDEEWVDLTLASIKAHINDKLKETE